MVIYIYIYICLKFLYLLILQLVNLQFCNNKDFTENQESKMPHQAWEEAQDFQLTENNAIPIQGQRLFRNP